jgi:ABC-type transport system involved in cytochrome c biogenesis permease subunit
MSPLDPKIPPAGEEIRLPGPTILPLLTAAGITLAIVGVTTSLILVIGGAVLTIACVIRWIMDTRSEIDELPLDSH